MKLIVLAAAAMLSFQACSGGRQSLPPPATTEGTEADAGPVSCTVVCARYAQLGCEAGKPTPRGVPCAVVCQNAVASGLIHWNLGCRAAASSCAEAESCEAR